MITCFVTRLLISSKCFGYLTSTCTYPYHREFESFNGVSMYEVLRRFLHEDLSFTGYADSTWGLSSDSRLWPRACKCGNFCIHFNRKALGKHNERTLIFVGFFSPRPWFEALRPRMDKGQIRGSTKLTRSCSLDVLRDEGTIGVARGRKLSCACADLREEGSS